MSKKLKLMVGAPVRTNDAFRRRFPQMTVWEGVLVREHATIAGAWHVEMTVPKGLPPQVINAKFLEATA